MHYEVTALSLIVFLTRVHVKMYSWKCENCISQLYPLTSVINTVFVSLSINQTIHLSLC